MKFITDTALKAAIEEHLEMYRRLMDEGLVSVEGLNSARAAIFSLQLRLEKKLIETTEESYEV